MRRRSPIPTPREIRRACITLFENSEETHHLFLRRMNAAEIKAAYRKQALRHHPDRARIMGLPPGAMAERFMKIRAAYEVLSGYLENRYCQSSRPNRRSGSAGEGRNNRGAPHRRPRQPLGQLLLSKGVISFSTLVEAILWQRRSRPSYGEIAVSMGVITDAELARILSSRRYGEKTGECAVRLGLVNSFSDRMIMERQRSLQKPLGEFFVERGIICSEKLEELLVSPE